MTQPHDESRDEFVGTEQGGDVAQGAPAPADAPPGTAPGEASGGAPDGATDGATGGATGDKPGEAAAEEAEADALTHIEHDLAERTADLQRLQAEFLNYKRRVERDRELIRENATFAALAPIVEVLDTIDRAREHGPLEDGFKAVAEQLERAVSNVGLRRFGAPGDPFDPTMHEALSHIGEDPGVQVTTAKVVAKAGYRIGDRVVRAAQVLVVDPAPGAADGGAADGPAEGPGPGQG